MGKGVTSVSVVDTKMLYPCIPLSRSLRVVAETCADLLRVLNVNVCLCGPGPC